MQEQARLAQWRSGRESKWLALVAMCLGLGMLMIDMFVVTVALPRIGADLDASLAVTGWVVTSYVLALAVLPVAMGRLGDLFGRKRLYLLGLVTFVLASVAAGAAPTMGALIGFRLIQGVGAATMMPGTLSIITQAFPARQRGLAIGIWGGVSGLGLVAGPVLGGLLVHAGSWRWIFLINVPVGLLAFVLAVLLVRESRDEGATRSLDWGGLVTLAGGLSLTLLAVSQLNAGSLNGLTLVGLFAAGVALLALFVHVERRVRAPLIDFALFRNVTFVAASVSAMLFSAAVFGAQPYVSLFMQNYWGFTPLEGGLAFVPATVLVALMMVVSGVLAQRLGRRLRFLLAIASLLVLASGVYLLTIDTESTYVDGLLPSFLIRGLGIGMFMSASSFAVVSSVPTSMSGLASGVLTMSRQVGTAVGVAVLGAVYLARIDSALPGIVEADQNIEAVAAAAEHFIAAGDTAMQAAAGQVIVDGFLAISAATIVLGLLAAAASLFIRHRPQEASEEPIGDQPERRIADNVAAG